MAKLSTKSTSPVIDLDDVRRAGGVRQALLAWCENSDLVSGGVIGSSFSTSGPGSGWSRNHGVSDYASRAFEGGALAYLDVDDGRMIEAEPVREDDADEDTLRDIAGCAYAEGDWSDESVVKIECPDVEDAIEHPGLVAEMAKAVIAHHGAKSDRKAWAKLITAIRDAAEAIEDIDADDFDAE